MEKLPKSFTTITFVSKSISIILFLTLPFIGFFFGMQYQYAFDLVERQTDQSMNLLPAKHFTKPITDIKSSNSNPSVSLNASQSATANWKTYTNINNNFSIKYPKDVKYEDVFDVMLNRGKNWIVDFISPNDRAALYIQNFDNPDSLSARDYFLQNQKEAIEYRKKNNLPPSNEEVIEEKQLKIGDADAYSILLDPHNSPKISETYIAGKNQMIIIRHDINAVQNDPETEENNRIFNLMISTFKFISKSTR